MRVSGSDPGRGWSDRKELRERQKELASGFCSSRPRPVGPSPESLWALFFATILIFALYVYTRRY